jgi:hypothetical protein
MPGCTRFVGTCTSSTPRIGICWRTGTKSTPGGSIFNEPQDASLPSPPAFRRPLESPARGKWVRRTVSRFLYRPFPDGGSHSSGPSHLLTGSSDLPGSRTERAAPPPLFGLAPRGACPASGIAAAAVRSYRTISPLPLPAGVSASGEWRCIFCGAFREIRFERTPPAVSRHAARWRPDFPRSAWPLLAKRSAAARPANPSSQLRTEGRAAQGSSTFVYAFLLQTT